MDNDNSQDKMKEQLIKGISKQVNGKFINNLPDQFKEQIAERYKGMLGQSIQLPNNDGSSIQTSNGKKTEKDMDEISKGLDAINDSLARINQSLGDMLNLYEEEKQERVLLKEKLNTVLATMKKLEETRRKKGISSWIWKF